MPRLLSDAVAPVAVCASPRPGPGGAAARSRPPARARQNTTRAGTDHAAGAALVAVVEILEPVHVVQVPGNRGVFAVDLERVQRFVTAGVTGGLEGGQRAVAEAGQERTGVIDADLLHLAGEVVLAFLHK